ncbi:corrinoid protein [Treponema putidum]|uniref:Cobalamin-binding protein n=1 Tax=Treponema putidum TaxID=221027 RepID=A0AAE9MWE8_9SPIR|nr:corrinoid protein [Treponema putidum]AIN93414.1 cobalamin-binding protein [Treponema putidum]TWI74484.1 methylmalonyl-CoA mutase cobalamin-binding domain/chain/corrinoid protein of di/trimethylamine methyltransferase [Treponema putidum]UTY29655.1 cobalamin-binding protein [Treponema putidum]UTY32125.1 cobalamin-binding protein [Treponema putidum]UTY34513.1 cobalamin-binding protein [Treponema putidum]
MEKIEYLQKLSDYVFEYEDEKIAQVAKDYLNEGYPALDAIMDGLVDGMKRAGDMFQKDEYFVTDILLCSDAMENALEVLRPCLEKKDMSSGHKIVMGVIEGDTHDIGKNLVKTMLQTEGFEVIDLGRDVPVNDFVDTAVKENAEIIAMSTLMTTTMPNMRRVIEKLENENMRSKFKIMIGGGPISQNFADKIKADGYSKDAVEAVKLAKRLVNI